MKPNNKINGQLTVTKIYVDDRPNEIVVNQENIITIGLASFLADIMMGDFPPGTLVQDVGLRWLQLGASAQDNYATNYFYELSSPYSISDYGEHTSLNFQTEYQVSAINPFYNPPSLTEVTGTFLELDDKRINPVDNDKVIFTILIDENTLNGQNIAEAGLFYNKAQKDKTYLLELGAYKAFGMTDGSGVVSPIAKTKDFQLQIEWVLSTNTGKVIDVRPDEVGSNYNFYKASVANPNGNALVCYFPNVASNNEPYTKYSDIVTEKQDNIELRLFQRLLSNGISIASFNYRFVDDNDISACRVFTSAVDDNTALLPSSTQPFRMPSGIENCFTDAVSSVQWAKYYGARNWDINPSNVFTIGNGIGGSLASFVAYTADCNSALGQDFEVCSSRVLGTSVKDAVTDWSRWFPYTLSTFDFKMATLPKAVPMLGSLVTVTGVANAPMESSATSNYSTDEFISSSISGIGSTSSYIFTDADFTEASGFYWSAIPDLKAHFQWNQVPLSSKKFWSAAHQASSTSSVIDSDFPGTYWGHPDNFNVYGHFSYAGSSVSGSSWHTYPNYGVTGTNFKLLNYTDNSYIDMGSVREPAVTLNFFRGNTDKSFEASAPAFLNAYYRDTSALANDMRDEMQGMQLWEQLSNYLGQNSPSSVFTNYAPTTLKTPGSDFKEGSTNVFSIWNYNMEELCARDRTNWLIKLLAQYDSWYDQFN